MIAPEPLRGVSLWRPCARGEHEVSLRAAGEALDRGLVTLIGARLRSATRVPIGWDPWAGAGLFRAGAALASPVLTWRAGDGLDGVLVGEALGVAVRAGAGELRLTLRVDAVETTRTITVTVSEAATVAWRGRATTLTDAAARRSLMARLMARATEGQSYARAGDGPRWTGARAVAQWRRATDAGRAVTWWAHDNDEARWVVRAEGDAAGLRVTVAGATETELADWSSGMQHVTAVERSSPWVEFG